MGLQEQINDALKDAMREKDEVKRNALRLLLTAMKNKEKELKRTLNDGEIAQLIGAQIKQRRDAAEQYLQGNRPELAATEEQETKVLQSFLPEPLSSGELERLIEEVIQEVGARSAKDMGAVMKALMPKVSGRADGKLVNQLVRQKLQP
jgi:hypothetical protein